MKKKLVELRRQHKRLIDYIKNNVIEETKSTALVEHLLLTASYSAEIAESEKLNTSLFFVAGLLHDIGKFRARRENLEEDTVSAELARRILGELGYPSELVDEVSRILSGRHQYSEIISDADILAKLGSLALLESGVKWGVRGAGFFTALISTLPRLLTIIYNIDKLLSTNYAKQVARKLSEISMQQVHSVIDQLREVGIELVVELEETDIAKIAVVRLTNCLYCGSKIELKVEQTTGKCYGAVLVYTCSNCNWVARSTLCIPVHHM